MSEMTIPDFNDMLVLISDIRTLMIKKASLEIYLEEAEASIVKEVTTNETYFVGGKPPSMAFIEATYKYTGLDKELIPIRLRKAEAVADLEKAKLTYDMMRMQIDVYRTESANQRLAAL